MASRRGSGPYGGEVPVLNHPVLTDDRIALRPWLASELSAQRDAIDEERAHDRGDRIDWALVDATRGEVLGGVSLDDVRTDHGRASIRYWLAPGARRRRAATDAVRLVARFAFEELGLRRLELTCGPDNTGAQGVAERCGFTREGCLRSQLVHEGARRDTLVFSLLPGELT